MSEVIDVEAKKIEEPKSLEQLQNEYQELCKGLGNEVYSFFLQCYAQIVKMQQVNFKGAELKGETKDDSSK